MSHAETIRFPIIELNRIKSSLRSTKVLNTIFYTIGDGGPFYAFHVAMSIAIHFSDEPELQNKIDEVRTALQSFLDEFLLLCELYHTEFDNLHYLEELITMLECAQAENFQILYPKQISHRLMMHKLST